jgi:hypothetical protein
MQQPATARRHRPGAPLPLGYKAEAEPEGQDRLQSGSMPMGKLDTLVVEHLCQRLLSAGARPKSSPPSPPLGRARPRKSRTEAPTPFRKAYIRSVVDRIEIGDGLIRIVGDVATLSRAVAGKQTGLSGVRGFERKWRPQRDSNPCLHRERVLS